MVKKAQSALGIAYRTVALVLLALLAFAGLMSFMGQVDPVISYTIAGFFTVFLVKEIL